MEEAERGRSCRREMGKRGKHKIKTKKREGKKEMNDTSAENILFPGDPPRDFTGILRKGGKETASSMKGGETGAMLRCHQKTPKDQRMAKLIRRRDHTV